MPKSSRGDFLSLDPNDVIEQVRVDVPMIQIARNLGATTRQVRRVIAEALLEGFLLPEEVTPSVHEEGQVAMSLVGSNGEVPQRSGLNWGLANANVNPNDAYFAIRISHLKQGFFLRHGALYDVEWDDGEIMTLVAEGTQPLNGEGQFPKQLCSFPDKARLGQYLRQRISVPAPERIVLRHLENLGTSVVVQFLGASKLRLFFQ